MPKIMSPELQKLREAQLHAEQAKNTAVLKFNAAKKKADDLADSERTHRLCVRGGHVESYLQDPELFTDDEVKKLIDFLFMSKFMKNLVLRMVDASNGKGSGTVMDVLDEVISKQRTKEDAAPVVPNG